jgi:hypothetical protein
MPRFGRRKFHRRVDGERLAELVAALALAIGGAIDEGEVLVRIGALLPSETLLDRSLEILGGIGVISILVLLQPRGERRMPLARMEEILDGTAGLRGAPAKYRARCGAHQHSEH